MRISEEKFESDIDMSLSNSSIGADAPAATFGKTAFADFASVRYKNAGFVKPETAEGLTRTAAVKYPMEGLRVWLAGRGMRKERGSCENT